MRNYNYYHKLCVNGCRYNKTPGINMNVPTFFSLFPFLINARFLVCEQRYIFREGLTYFCVYGRNITKVKLKQNVVYTFLN